MKGLYLRTVYFLGLKSGGSVTHTAGVINSLSKKIDLDVFSNDHLATVTHPVTIIPPILKGVPFFNELLYNFRVVRAVKNHEYSFLYQRYSSASFAGAYLSSKWGMPFILEFNSSEVWKLRNWSKTNNPIKNFVKKFIQLPITKRIEKYNLKKASLIVVVSEVLKNNLLQEGIEAKKILVNPNGVDIERFETNGKNKSLLNKLNLNNKFVVGFIGSFGKWHGVLELAKAAVDFYEKYPYAKDSVRFLIIGDGKLFPQAKAIIDGSLNAQFITLTGAIPQEDSPAYLSCCDLFLSPHIPNPDGTKFFGSPTKLFEYMAANRPIIASKLDQIDDILEHGETAYLVEPGNIAQLVDAIFKLSQDQTYRDHLANNALKLVKDQFTWDAHVEHILETFKTV